MERYNSIPADTWETISKNAGIIVDTFNPATKAIGTILGATTGDINFKDSITFSDWGDDINGAKKNTKELKVIDEREITFGGTFVTIDAEKAKMLIAAADIDPNNSARIIPRTELSQADFSEFWWLTDYGNGGVCALHIWDALSTDGFQMNASDKAKTQFPFTFTAHPSLDDSDTVPYELYIDAGDDVTPEVKINKRVITLADGDTATLRARTTPAGQTVTWSSSSSSVATVAAGVVTAEGEGNAVITASITVEGVTYTDTCTVIVEAAA